MATTLTINLDSTFTDWLKESDVTGYAILYGSRSMSSGGGDTPLASVTLDASSSTATLTLTSGSEILNAGKIYFIVQSTTDSSKVIDPTTIAQNEINWNNAKDGDYRYDSIELTLSGSTTDAVNLTVIEGFGFSMGLETSSGTRGYAVNGDTIITDLTNAPTDHDVSPVTKYKSGGLHGDTRLIQSPAVAVKLPSDEAAYSTSNWSDYLGALKNTDKEIVINGYFNGAGDIGDGQATTVWRNAGFYSYTLIWVADESEPDGGYFRLDPTDGSEIKGYLKISFSDLENSIYSTLGTASLYSDEALTDPVELYTNETTGHQTNVMGTGANNAWGTVLQQLTLGLTAGYLESSGTSLNSEVSEKIDLNKNYNWDPTYAFGEHTTTSLDDSVKQRWDPYEKVIFENSNAYGTQYGDALTAAYSIGSPLLSTYDKTTGTDVENISITLFGDNANVDDVKKFYTTPEIYNYVKGDHHVSAEETGTGEAADLYQTVKWYSGNGTNINLILGSGQSLVLDKGTDVTFRFITGYDHTTPIWHEVQIPNDGVSPWQNWTFSYDSATDTYSLLSGPAQPQGTIQLTGLPMAANGVAWYQIVVGEEGSSTSKTFNFYTTTETQAGESVPSFLNFSLDAYADQFGIDGLATLAAPADDTSTYLTTFDVNISTSNPTLDLSLFTNNTDPTYYAILPQNTVAVAGTLENGAFAALAGQTADIFKTVDDKAIATDTSITSHTGTLVFGWTGLNNAEGAATSTWIEQATNLIQADAMAVVNIKATSGVTISPLVAQADTLGAWHTTTAQQLGNGTYEVTMTSYLHATEKHDVLEEEGRLTNASATLTVNVSLSELQLQADKNGDSLSLIDDGSDTEGNWLHITSTDTPLPSGNLLLLYATDADGNLVSSDGTAVSSIEDAVLASVGAVASDSGDTIIDAQQSVFLQVGQQLHFAVQDRNGTIVTDSAAAMTLNDDGTANIDVGGIVLSAEVDNNLSAIAQSAAVQRMYDLPLVYLTEGEQVTVEVAGSAANTNTLSFVRVNFNPATGAISVGDEVAANSDAFREAVKDELNNGYEKSLGGGDFSDVSQWTVTGATGYYAPVLITESGEIMIFGNNNADGNEYLRTFGENSFGFEDLTAAQGSDFDYNDMLVKVVPNTVTDDLLI